MYTCDLFTSTCLALALNRLDAGILESLLAENAVLIHSGANCRIEGKQAILAFFRIWLLTLSISMEAGLTSLNAELAKVSLKGKSQACLLIRQNVRGGTRRFLGIFLSRDGLIDSIEFSFSLPDSLEELNIFPV